MNPVRTYRAHTIHRHARFLFPFVIYIITSTQCLFTLFITYEPAHGHHDTSHIRRPTTNHLRAPANTDDDVNNNDASDDHSSHNNNNNAIKESASSAGLHSIESMQ